MELEPMEKEIKSLIQKAASAEKSEDAMRFSQAACNASNALLALNNNKRN